MSNRPFRAATARLAILAALGAFGCGSGSADEPSATATGPPNVLVLTVDTLRPDALGWIAGHDRTPHMDGLAEAGFRFPNPAAPAPLTLPSHASMFSGLVPRRHGVRDNGQVLPEDTDLLPEALSAAGYETAAFVSGYPLSATFGIDQGFATFDDEVADGGGAWLERKADATVEAALGWARNAPEPWFLWVHFYDPHLPYEPPARFAAPGSGARALYDGEVAFVDEAIGRLVGELDGRFPAPRLTVFAADHGESLGEHGENTHGFFIYDSTVRVPMTFSWPGRIPAGETGSQARLVDLGPTVRDLLGLPAVDGVDGISLAAAWSNGSLPPTPAYVETIQPWTSYGWAPLAAIRTDRWKLVKAPRAELYDLRADPGETTNLVTEERRRARELADLLAAHEARPGRSAASVGDPETLAKLTALGYVGGEDRRAEIPATGLADPKDMAAVRETLTRGEEHAMRGDFAAAVERYEAVLADHPDNRFALSRSAIALVRLGRAEDAIARLERVVELDPNQPDNRSLLAETLSNLGRFEEAIPHWMELVRLQPERATAWSNLAASLGRTGKAGEAVEAMERAVELSPGNTDRMARLAFALIAAGRESEAIAKLEEIASLTGPTAFPYNGTVGILYVRQGKAAEAVPWLERSRPGEGDYPQARAQLTLIRAAGGTTP